MIARSPTSSAASYNAAQRGSPRAARRSATTSRPSRMTCRRSARRPRGARGAVRPAQRDVNNKQDELVDTLAQKYVEDRDAVDARIEEMKAANRGLVDKALDAIGGVIQTILKLKDMLLSVLSKAADVIGDIIADPIGFLGNLVSGIKPGLTSSSATSSPTSRTALMGWLFGALGVAGIQMPETFDLTGILDLVTQVLGLTYREHPRQGREAPGRAGRRPHRADRRRLQDARHRGRRRPLGVDQGEVRRISRRRSRRRSRR